MLAGGIWLSWPASGGSLLAGSGLGNLLIALGYLGWGTENFMNGQRDALFNVDDIVKFARDFLDNPAEAPGLAEQLLVLLNAQLPPQPQAG